MKITRRLVSAFTLVEVTLALGIAAFSLIAIFGLLPVGLNSNQVSIEQTAAASLTTAIIADLCAVPAGSAAKSPKFGFSLPAASSTQTVYIGEDGSAATAPATSGGSASRYRVTLGLTSPASGKMATAVRLMVTWPALADAQTPATEWPSKFAGFYETVTALDRN